jgi:hypothetical protein
MNYWYINTEAKAFDGESPDAQWFKHGRAFVSGVKGPDAEKFACKLHQLQRGDIVFMYANIEGVVAVGSVLERCDQQPAKCPLVYCLPRHTKDNIREYQAKVDWSPRFRDPIPPNKLRCITGSFARQAIQRIADPVAAKALLEQARQQARAE